MCLPVESYHAMYMEMVLFISLQKVWDSLSFASEQYPQEISKQSLLTYFTKNFFPPETQEHAFRAADK